MLFITIVSNDREFKSRLYRRFTKIATNARTSRALFQGNEIKELDISEFINTYNHFMNGVDIIDQLRSYYNT